MCIDQQESRELLTSGEYVGEIMKFSDVTQGTFAMYLRVYVKVADTILISTVSGTFQAISMISAARGNYIGKKYAVSVRVQSLNNSPALRVNSCFIDFSKPQ